MTILDLMKEYCDHLFETDEPEAMEMYQALLPAVIRCEASVGDAIECDTADLVQEVANFIQTYMSEMELTREQLNSVVEDTIEFIIKSILDTRKE